MGKTYVMTDIHGRLEPLKSLLAQIPEGAKIVFLGDYVDRGSQSREVVALVRSLPNAVCLRGNHEDMVCADHRNWLANGGASTLMSYQNPMTGEVDVDVLIADIAWFYDLPTTHSDDRRVYVHAGVDPSYDLADQAERMTQWYRYPEGADVGYRGKTVVHGHTPGVFQGQHRICLDAGMSKMCCGVFDDDGDTVELLWA
jgi:serine/threonine protein phosphatase 1